MRKFIALFLALLLNAPALAQGTGGGGPPIGAYKNATSGGGGGGAPDDARYVLLNANAVLTQYRILTGGTNIGITDGGAKNNVTVALTGQVALANGGTAGATRQAGINNLTDVAGGAAGDIYYNNGTNFTRLAAGSNGDVLTLAAGLPAWSTTSLGAPTTAQYVTLATDGTLTQERVLTGTANRITLTDGGAGGNITLDIGSSVATLTGAQTLTNKILDAPVFTTSYLLRGSTFDGTVTWADWAAARALSIPDPGSAAQFVLNAGNSTIGGVKTFSSSPVLSTNTVTSSTANTITFPNATDTLVNLNSSQVLTNKELTSAQLSTDFRLKTGSNRYLINWDALAADRTITVKDVGTDSRMVLGSTSFTYSAGAIPYGNGNTLSMASAGTSSQALLGGSTPCFGTLPAAGGGTGITTVPGKASILVGNAAGNAYANLSASGVPDGYVPTTDSGATNGVSWQPGSGAVPNLTSSTGIVAQTGSTTYSARSVVDAGTTSKGVTVTNADGTSGNITLATTDYQVKTVLLTFTPAQVKLLNSQPQTVVAQVPGYQIHPLFWKVHRKIGTVVYGGSATLHLSSNAGIGGVYDYDPVIPAGVLTNANASIPTAAAMHILYSTTLSSGRNHQGLNNLTLKASSNPTGASADCEVQVMVVYMLIPNDFDDL